MKHHAKVFAAQCELANKRPQSNWKIHQTENGWFVVVRKTAAEIANDEWQNDCDRDEWKTDPN